VSETPPLRVLFVCLGNICRSPAAHAVVQAEVSRRDLDGVIDIDSAGTGSWHVGQQPHQMSRAEGSRRGYRVDHVVRQVTRADMTSFDLVVPMDVRNRRDLLALSSSGGARIRLLRSFDPTSEGIDADLADPYGGTEADFAAMYDVIERSAGPLVDHLETMVAPVGR
jgi:protein-tyrosine phosphatase